MDVLLGVHERAELLGRLGRAQRRAEVGVQEQRGESAQHLEVGVGLAVRRRDQEEQRGRLAVERLVVHARGHRHGRETRRGDGGRLGVRDGDAVAEARGELRLALANGRGIARLVAHVAALRHEVNELVDGLVLALGRTPYPD